MSQRGCRERGHSDVESHDSDFHRIEARLPQRMEGSVEPEHSRVNFQEPAVTTLRELTDEISAQQDVLRAGGGEAGRERQKRLGRLTVRERLQELLDADAPFFELGLWAAWQMYPEWGEVPAAGVVTGIGCVEGRPVLVVANDATVKAGAFFPQSVKKV